MRRRTLNVDSAVIYHRGRKGAAVRDGHAEEAEAADKDLRMALLDKRIRDLGEQLRDMTADQYAAYVDSVVDELPPLTDAQRARLAVLIRSGRTE